MAPEVSIGAGVSEELATALQGYPGEVLLVRGRESFLDSGARDVLVPQLTNRVVTEYVVKGRVPTVVEALAAREEIRETPGVIVAVGGGTVLDSAKIISLAFNSTPSVEGFLTDARSPQIPIVAIPTTAGSGAERTHFAVAYVGKTKHSIERDGLAPAIALVDPRLTRSMGPALTATSGIDAIAHAMESLWSTRSTLESQRNSLDALSAGRALARAVTDPDDESRGSMALAATTAGLAISVARTTAAHALSYYLTVNHGVPHGAAVALSLPALLEFNAATTEEDCLDSRGAEHVRLMVSQILTWLGARDAVDARERLEGLITSIGLPTRFSALDGPVDVSEMAAAVNHERLRNNPRSMNGSQIVQLLESVT
jgi:alcohol dehydrogenase class IV